MFGLPVHFLLAAFLICTFEPTNPLEFPHPSPGGCPKVRHATTSLQGRMWNIFNWVENQPLMVDICMRYDYPTELLPGNVQTVLSTDNKTYVVQYNCYDYGKEHIVSVNTYTLKKNPGPNVLRAISEAHSHNGFHKKWLDGCKHGKLPADNMHYA